MPSPLKGRKEGCKKKRRKSGANVESIKLCNCYLTNVFFTLVDFRKYKVHIIVITNELITVYAVSSTPSETNKDGCRKTIETEIMHIIQRNEIILLGADNLFFSTSIILINIKTNTATVKIVTKIVAPRRPTKNMLVRIPPIPIKRPIDKY